MYYFETARTFSDSSKIVKLRIVIEKKVYSHIVLCAYLVKFIFHIKVLTFQSVFLNAISNKGFF